MARRFTLAETMIHTRHTPFIGQTTDTEYSARLYMVLVSIVWHIFRVWTFSGNRGFADKAIIKRSLLLVLRHNASHSALDSQNIIDGV